MPKFETKNAFFGYFGARILKSYSYIWNQHARTSVIQKIWQKIPKFGTKNALIGYFGVGIWKQYCHIWNYHPQICIIGNFRKIIKMPKFWNENA